MGKEVCVHTHINNKQEISWITRQGAQRLYEEGVIVRNQSVMLNGVNNTFEQMSELVHTFSELHIEPVSLACFCWACADQTVLRTSR